MAQTSLTQEEIDERVAILQRLRKLLEQQRDKFREYLNVLEAQHQAIDSGETDTVMAHTDLEQQVLSNIVNLKRVIKPLEHMYHMKSSSSVSADVISSESGLSGLKTDLDSLQQKVLEQNEKNRNLLQTRITEMKTAVRSMKNPYTSANRSPYSSNNARPAIIDVQL